ncbi:MAG TPA: Holliday junction resolvase [Candidatus Thermoplasmatota archaeon]|nr:Holliday junction resolvase [Candidatus Thermoplasmatota archaeon]
MGKNGSAWERELKGILAGDDAALRDAARSCPPDEAKNYLKAAGRPFLVVRGAGSLGIDLVALRADVSFPIEVKGATAPVIRFSDESGRMQEQARAMSAECGRAGVIPLYAYRRKGVRGGDAWRVFTLPADGLDGRLRVLYDRVPKVARTPAGGFVMRWDEGLPLNKLLDYLCASPA